LRSLLLISIVAALIKFFLKDRLLTNCILVTKMAAWEVICSSSFSFSYYLISPSRPVLPSPQCPRQHRNLPMRFETGESIGIADLG
jgi:hypothetical protein